MPSSSAGIVSQGAETPAIPSARFVAAPVASETTAAAGTKIATSTTAADRSRFVGRRRAALFSSMRPSRARSSATGSPAGSEPSASARPSAVGATSAIETMPGILVCSEVSRPRKPGASTAIGYRRSFACATPPSGRPSTILLPGASNNLFLAVSRADQDRSVGQAAAEGVPHLAAHERGASATRRSPRARRPEPAGRPRPDPPPPRGPRARARGRRPRAAAAAARARALRRAPARLLRRRRPTRPGEARRKRRLYRSCPAR